MYAIGVLKDSNVASSENAGVYLFQNQHEGGWGAGGDGCKSFWEPYGQEWGRWFVPLPYGVVAVSSPASVSQYAGRLYLTGGYSYNTVIDEHHRMWKQGIMPPAEYPEVTGSGVAAGNYAYFSWYDEYTDERSPLSKELEIGASVPRTWENLPLRPPDDIYAGDETIEYQSLDAYWTELVGGLGTRINMVRAGDKLTNDIATPNYLQISHMGPLLLEGTAPAGAASAVIVPVTRATHLELWLSMNGDLPRLAMRVPVGTTEVEESVADDELGEAFITSFMRFPRCRFNAIYHDRQIMAGDPENPDTVYLSALYYPERYEGLYFRTRDGQSITGILSTRDYCLVFTRSTTYMLQGYTDTDYSFTVVDQSLGAVGHQCNVVIHGNPYVWTEKGPYMFNGQWHPLSPENRWTPVSDQFISGSSSPRTAEAGQLMIATDDPRFNTYIVSSAQIAAMAHDEPYMTGSFSSDHFYAVLDYTMVQPEVGGAMSSARLSFDTGTIGSPFGGSFSPYHFMKHLRNRWGQGTLYHIGAYWSEKRDTFGRYGAFSVIGLGGLPFVKHLYNTDAFTSRIDGNYNSSDGDYSAYQIRQRSRIVTGFMYFDAPDAYLMESKSFKRIWFHMRNPIKTDAYTGVTVYSAPDSGWWRLRLNNTTGPDRYMYKGEQANPSYPDLLVTPSYTFTAATLYKTPAWPDDPDSDVGIGDIITPVLPDSLPGRGLWLEVSGYRLQWHGFGVQFTLGADSGLWYPAAVPQ
jgi:hypothetical protein